ncbi:MAG TPA: hypothetical protein VMH49_00975 [Thermoplasmata archaeon]|nr:hypothetical protein [Thermoplasmata archaeon]
MRTDVVLCSVHLPTAPARRTDRSELLRPALGGALVPPGGTGASAF